MIKLAIDPPPIKSFIMKATYQTFNDLETLIHILNTSFRQAVVSEALKPLSSAAEQALQADEDFNANINMMSDDLRLYYYCNERAKNIAYVLQTEYDYFFVADDTLYGNRNNHNILLLTLDESRLS